MTQLRISRSTLLASILLCTLEAYAQVRLTPQEARQLLIGKPEVPYSPIAKAARAEGVVSVEIRVSDLGTVTGAWVTQGHPLNRDTAVTSISTWKYQPHLVDGNPVPFATVVDIVFPSGFWVPLDEVQRRENERQAALALRYSSENGMCDRLVHRLQWKEAEASCKASVEISEQLTALTPRRKVQAYEALGHVLRGQHRYREAIEHYSRALDTARLSAVTMHADIGSLYGDIAMSHDALHETGTARKMYRKAEMSYFIALDKLARGNGDEKTPQVLRKAYETRLKQLLGYHLTAARRAGDPDEAQEVRKMIRTVR
ncbi:MAG: tetratricopeptide repeat protein [Acidobacteriota bacterium]